MGYASQYHDYETGFVYLRARYYSPAVGRFINEDPIRDGLNWYAYCHNDPVNFVDPSGYITQEEIDMYENGEMAPMAYTYLMGLTYMWYYVDTQEEKDDIHQLAEDFRKNEYKTTNGVFPTVDQGIAFMPTRPDGTYTMTREEHFFRNELNIQLDWEDFEKLQEKLPENLKWEELGFWGSAYHKFDLRTFEYAPQGNNRKYVSACGHFEAVYTKENYLLSPDFHSPYMGTYNYYSYKNPEMHDKYDVDTWRKWGTVPDNN